MTWILTALIYVGVQVILIAVLPTFGRRFMPTGVCASNAEVCMFDSHDPIAFATGMLWFKKVIVSTGMGRLLSKMEYQAVLTHEAGHHALAHIPKMIGIHTLLALSVAFLMSLLPIINIWFFIPYCIVVILVFSMVAEPAFDWVSRKFELQADHFCKERGLAPALMEALIKLNKKGKTHPSLEERLEALRDNESAE